MPRQCCANEAWNRLDRSVPAARCRPLACFVAVAIEMRSGDLVEYLLLAAIWGGSFLLTRVAVPEFGPFALMFVRCGAAAVLMVGYLAVRGQLSALRGNLWRSGLIGIVGSAMPFALLGYGLVSLSAGLGSILNATTPMFTALVGWLWMAERLPAARAAGIAIGFAGVVVLAWSRLTGGVGAWLPVAACLMSTLCYGVAANATRRYLADVPALIGATGSQIGAALALAPFAAFSWPTPMPSALAWGNAITLAAVCTAVAYLLYFRLIKHAGAQRAATVTYVIPLFGVLWGAWLLGERLEPRQLLGGAIIIVGSALAIGLLRLGRRPVPLRPPAP